jgi:hypothetical protein
MKTHGIEWLHAKLHSQIRVVASYLEVPEMEFIIEACRLKPYEHLFEMGKRTYPVVLRKWWVDEFGNSLTLKKKEVSIIYHDLRLDRKKIIGTDLYHGLSIDKVAKMSKLVYLVSGKDEDLHEDCCLLTFLGIDNHLRSYLYWNRGWSIVSPLLLGLEDLKQLAKYHDVAYFRELPNQKDCPVPCLSKRTCVSCVPVGSGFLDTLKREYEWLLPIFEDK